MNCLTAAAPSILLVEDDEAVRRALQLLLLSNEYQVRAYPSSSGLAKDAGALNCSCLIADLVLPPSNAIALLKELRAASWTGKSILISGLLDPFWEAKAVAAGYDAVLHKPISNSVLIRTVTELLHKNGAQRPAG